MAILFTTEKIHCRHFHLTFQIRIFIHVLPNIDHSFQNVSTDSSLRYHYAQRHFHSAKFSLNVPPKFLFSNHLTLQNLLPTLTHDSIRFKKTTTLTHDTLWIFRNIPCLISSDVSRIINNQHLSIYHQNLFFICFIRAPTLTLDTPWIYWKILLPFVRKKFRLSSTIHHESSERFLFHPFQERCDSYIRHTMNLQKNP